MVVQGSVMGGGIQEDKYKRDKDNKKIITKRKICTYKYTHAQIKIKKDK